MLHGVATGRILAAVLCGPHRCNNEYSPRFHRIDSAIEVAGRHDFRLLVCGDAAGGLDVRLFVGRARERGVDASGAYDPRARTIHDVQSILRRLEEDPSLHRVDHLVLVSDGWHLERSEVYIQGERDTFLPRERPLRVIPCPAHGGPEPTPTQLAGERQGISDYLCNRPYRPFTEIPDGKPDTAMRLVTSY